MLSYVLTFAILALVFLFLCGLGFLGERNGDMAGDALVSVVTRGAGQPGESRPVLSVTVTNPTDTPVLAALDARRALLPGLLAGSYWATVPYRTKKFRASDFPTVGVVAGQAIAAFAVPVRGRARRYLLTAVVGQQDSRLRRYRLRVEAARPAAPAPASTDDSQSGAWRSRNS